LQLIFAAELLTPSRRLWIVSPWLRDIPVLDNSTGAFRALCPDFPPSEIHLSRLLRELIDRGTRVIVATRPDQGNRQVIDAIGDLGEGLVTDRLVVHQRSELHAKGVVGDRYALHGSMNLTFNALDNLTEVLVFQTDRAQLETLRLSFQAEYGDKV
jgi:hypothetical protein